MNEQNGQRPTGAPSRGAGPEISFIVPCYNAAATLPDTLASIRGQTCPDWEAVCVDDASTDETPQLLDDAARQDERFRVIHAPHGGLGASRNRALDAACGTRFLFLDADDIVLPEAVETLIHASRRAGDRTLLAGGYELMDEGGKPLGLFRFPVVPEFSVDSFLQGNRLSPMTLVPRDVMGARRFSTVPDVHGAEDWDLWCQLAASGVRCTTVPRVLYRYRLRMRSLGHDVDRIYRAAAHVVNGWRGAALDAHGWYDLAHRMAAQHGAMGLAAGDRHAIWRFFEPLEPLVPDEEFERAVAEGIRQAFEFMRGARGERWPEHEQQWLEEIEAWLAESPLVGCHEGIMQRLRRLGKGADDRLRTALDFLEQRSDAARVIVYGLGTNGLTLLHQLRENAEQTPGALCAADDYADPLTFELLDMPREDPLLWQTWPDSTVVILTPDNANRMRETLRARGGRLGVDFAAVAGTTPVSRPRAVPIGGPA